MSLLFRTVKGGLADAARGAFWRRRSSCQTRAFTLTEVLFAVLIVAIVFTATMSALSIHRVQYAKANQRNIALDFANHYLELVRGMDFTQLQAGAPINSLYDGTGGSPAITIPVSSAWVELDTDDFQQFHPELVWLENHNPELRVVLTVTQENGEAHTKHLSLELRWDSPLARGKRLEARMDIVRVKDLSP